ncbi:GNAT family N-acetyltransferase [Thalassospira sp.]|uniref:GNAT family N-acetyltransferase n=1 Tax=Thalassospira sp. TaxID=1912094 RepID=UPI000C5D972A|nr:GNAT family N-acetyltransferase [Thalassospira sp.]MBC07197.1 GNAT family N-acetyltransferase [Thalassospira sp.]|tara:strand:- start:2626 stop:3264 length:639 start_codon:yes stop_codon:yes gene_type:complete
MIAEQTSARAAQFGAAHLPRTTSFVKATKSDADAMAELINIAGEGLPAYLWQGMASADETAFDVGRKRAARDEGGFSYRNTTLAVRGGETIAALVDYAQPDQPEPVDPSELPAMFVPLIELENLAPGSWYINVLAVFPDHRDQGVGSDLIARAEANARQAGKKTVSLIASDGNPGAMRLYQRHGFVACAKRAMVKEDWENPGRNWVLMIKEI